jgi:hypothetical protein
MGGKVEPSPGREFMAHKFQARFPEKRKSTAEWGKYQVAAFDPMQRRKSM